MRQISALQLHDMLALDADSKPALIDVREPWEFDIAKIEGSTLIPMSQIPAKAESLDRARPTVVICHHGMRSLQVIAFLQRQGFENLHNLQGGIEAWSRQVDPKVAVY